LFARAVVGWEMRVREQKEARSLERAFS